MSKLFTPDMAEGDLYELSGIDREDESLNSDSEYGTASNFDNADFYAPYSFKDIEEHIGTITSLENRLTDLLYLSEDIYKAQGMNQSFAMEAERLIPEFNKVPLGYYSKDTTATRFKVSLEEIDKGIWALIIAAAVAVVALIAKFISWLTGGSSGSSGSSGGGGGGGGSSSSSSAFKPKTKTAEEGLKDVETLLQTTEDEIDYVHKLNSAKLVFENGFQNASGNTIAGHHDSGIVSGQGTKVELSIDEVLSKYLEKNKDENTALIKALTEASPILVDITTNGEYTKEIHAIIEGNVVGIILQAIRETHDRFKTLIDMDLTGETYEAKTALTITRISLLQKENLLMKDIPITSLGNSVTVKEILNNINSLREKTLRLHKSETIKFSNLFQFLKEGIIRSRVAASLTTVISFNSELKNIESEVDITARKIKNGIPQVSEAGRRAFFHGYVEAIIKELSDFKNGIKLAFEVSKKIEEYKDALVDVGTVYINTVAKSAMKIVKKELHASGGTLTSEQKEMFDKIEANVVD